MFPTQRRRILQDWVDGDGYVSMSEASAEFNVSTATIRRDLIAMESNGSVERTRGGALRKRQLAAESLYGEKDLRNPEAKRRIAVCAAGLVANGSTVLVNSGSTNRQVLRQIFLSKECRVVTSHAAAPLEYRGSGELIVTGGLFRERSNSFVGLSSLHEIWKVVADVCIIGVDGLSLEMGVTTPAMAERDVARAMMDSTNGTKVVVIDSSKLGVVANFQTAKTDEIDVLVTEVAPPREIESSLEELGVRVLVSD